MVNTIFSNICILMLLPFVHFHFFSCLQSLQALKKISLEHPTACLRAGALMAVLSYLDFFSTGVQVASSCILVVKLHFQMCNESHILHLEAVVNEIS